LGNHEKIIGVYSDLQKAFNTVDQKISIYKLSMYDIRGTVLSCFKNYLSNYKQFTVLADAKSDIF